MNTVGADERRAVVRENSMCPDCRGRLTWHADLCECTGCAKLFPFASNLPKFHDQPLPSTYDAAFQADQMWNTGIAARMYNFGKRFVNSEYMRRDHITEAVAAAPRGSVIVELGSGNRRLRDDIINIELFPFPNVDLLADVAKLPIADDAADLVIMDSLIEHVPRPHDVVAEAHRILKPGGTAICVVPFVFPYHGYPKHYCNFSKDGLEVLFGAFASRNIETNVGPTAALTNLVSEYFAVAVGGNSSLRYTIAKGVGLLPLTLFKYVDRFWSPTRSQRLASTLCATATK